MTLNCSPGEQKTTLSEGKEEGGDDKKKSRHHILLSGTQLVADNAQPALPAAPSISTAPSADSAGSVPSISNASVSNEDQHLQTVDLQKLLNENAASLTTSMLNASMRGIAKSDIHASNEQSIHLNDTSDFWKELDHYRLLNEL